MVARPCDHDGALRETMGLFAAEASIAVDARRPTVQRLGLRMITGVDAACAVIQWFCMPRHGS
jgi:hypothetical protein